MPALAHAIGVAALAVALALEQEARAAREPRALLVQRIRGLRRGPARVGREQLGVRLLDRADQEHFGGFVHVHETEPSCTGSKGRSAPPVNTRHTQLAHAFSDGPSDFLPLALA